MKTRVFDGHTELEFPEIRDNVRRRETLTLGINTYAVVEVFYRTQFLRDILVRKVA